MARPLTVTPAPDGRVARSIGRQVDVVFAIARDVDHRAPRHEGRRPDQACRIFYGAGDVGVAVRIAARHVRDAMSEGVGAGLVRDHQPRHCDGLILKPRPLHDGNGNAAVRPALNGGDQIRMPERPDETGALQFELVPIDAVGDVERQHEHEIDRRRRAHAARRRQQHGARRTGDDHGRKEALPHGAGALDGFA